MMMVLLLYFLNIACSSGQSALGKRYAARGGDASVFNLNKAMSGLVTFLVFALWNRLSFHIPTLLLGLCYGAFLCISMHSGFRALSMGPIALTSIVASFSLIIPFWFGIALWGENLSLFAAIGMLFLISSIILLNFKRAKGGISLKWWFFAFLTLLSNGICSVIQKHHQITYPGEYRAEFMLSALICVLFILVAAKWIKRNERQVFQFNTAGIISGLMNCAANYIILYLAATEKASVLFPTVSIANVIAVWLLGRIVFKERLTAVQVAGLALGMIAIILLNLNP